MSAPLEVCDDQALDEPFLIVDPPTVRTVERCAGLAWYHRTKSWAAVR
jgi:hypothetical protein